LVLSWCFFGACAHPITFSLEGGPLLLGRCSWYMVRC
jgi:hypothetical protein